MSASYTPPDLGRPGIVTFVISSFMGADRFRAYGFRGVGLRWVENLPFRLLGFLHGPGSHGLRVAMSASLGSTNITPIWTFRIGSQGLCLRPYPKEVFLQVIGL